MKRPNEIARNYSVRVGERWLNVFGLPCAFDKRARLSEEQARALTNRLGVDAIIVKALRPISAQEALSLRIKSETTKKVLEERKE